MVVLLADEEGRPIKTQEEYQTEGRERIAGQMTRYCRRLGFTAARMATWTDGQWLEAARGAEVRTAVRDGKVPSPATRRVVLAFMSDWEAATA